MQKGPMNIENYCNHFYNFTYIPIYYYVNGNCIFGINSDPDHIGLPLKVERLLVEEKQAGDIYETEIASYYGRVKSNALNEMFIIGPVKSESYTDAEIAKFEHIYQIAPNDREAYEKQLRITRKYTLIEFYHLLSMIQETIGSEFENVDTFETVDNNKDLEEFAAQKSDKYEENLKINIVAAGNRFAPYIKEGNIGGLLEESKRGQDFYLGEYSSDKRDNQLVIMIISLTFALKAAVEGGMPEKEGYLLIRDYIAQALKAQSAVEVDTLSMQASMALVHHMRDFLDQGIKRSSLYDCIKYIRENVYSPISVSDVAVYSGYSEEYFSRLFKKEIGFGAQEFIYNCKLIEAKNLLKSTSFSIGEISNRLYFSNQSHFQRRFKEKYGMTPKEYRDSEEY